jgi:hypothetical protein
MLLTLFCAFGVTVADSFSVPFPSFITGIGMELPITYNKAAQQ